MVSSKPGRGPTSPFSGWGARRVGLLAIVLAAIGLLVLKMQADGTFSSSINYHVLIALAGLVVAFTLIHWLRKKQ